MDLVAPTLDRLPAYADALARGFFADNHRREASAREELAEIAADPAAFVASLDDPAAVGPPMILPDGSRAPRLPSRRLWMWDGEGFGGQVTLRWQAGTAALPDYCPGHVGYAVVAWRYGQGLATRARALALPEMRALGLPHIELITAFDNLASQKVILANGGTLVERFRAGPAYGHREGLRFRIAL
ncbi:MAG: GNAT family N-acetyltransferase [Alphaproteobacteria bacterium]|nr:GNAT family N-acetyltransferase [Alphaproteobacteria bacterium]